jgi:DNA polymerase (family 10)
MTNAEIADIFYRMAELLELGGREPFRARAYRRAAITIGTLAEPAADLASKGFDFDALPGVGEDLAAKIREICLTGRLRALEALEAQTPSRLVALSAVPGLGPKRLQTLKERLDVDSVEALTRAAAQGRLRDLPRVGKTFEARLLKALGGPERGKAG